MSKIVAYVDESGDVGIDHGSKFFIIGCVIADAESSLRNETDVHHLLLNINSNLKHRRSISEFKFSSNDHDIKIRVLRAIKKLKKLEIHAICINKDLVPSRLREDPKSFYRNLIVNNTVKLLIDKCLDIGDSEIEICFNIDRSLHQDDQVLFDEYYKSKLDTELAKINRKLNIRTTIRHEYSQNLRLLQIADCVAGAVQQKMERGNPEYYDIIATRIEYHEIGGQDRQD